MKKITFSGADIALIYDALASHIEAVEAFLSDAGEEDEVDVVRDELVHAKELRERVGHCNG